MMLVFDFDGVLMDSVNEVIVTAHNAVFPEPVWTFDEVQPAFRGFMRSNRCRPRTAGEICALAAWAKDNLSALPQGVLPEVDFKLIIEAGESALERMEAAFFEIRESFMSRHKKAWLALNTPYQPIWEEAARCAPGQFMIVTYKNKTAVKELCSEYGLQVDEESICSASGGGSKGRHLLAIKEHPQRVICYIDDSLRNLEEIRACLPAEGYTLLWADWGYRSPEDPIRTQVLHFPAVSQGDVVQLIRKECVAG